MFIKHFLSIVFALLVLQANSPLAQSTKPNYDSLRLEMVNQQIEFRGINNQLVLNAMKEIPRHLFVPEYYRGLAYTDQALPIAHNQTISQPLIVAYMTQLLDIDSSHSVLEIGTGSGYQAAVLSKIAQTVYTIEIIPELAHAADHLIKALGYNGIYIKTGDGYLGWPEFAPFDRIIVTAAPEKIPENLVRQLKIGGRMVIPTGPNWIGQDLLVIEKYAADSISINKTIPVAFVPMIKGQLK